MQKQISKARKLHLQAEKLREEDKLAESLVLYDQAIKLYEKEENFAGAAEAYLGKFLTYKHLYILSQDGEDAQKGFAAIYASEKLAKKHNIEKLFPVIHFEHGSWFRILEEYKEAIPHFQEALELHQGSLAEKGDYQYHLGFVQYQAGEKKVGKKNLLAGLEKIQLHKDTVGSFLAAVWESGAQLCIAECLWGDEPEKARTHLAAAEKIINNDSRLVIRKRQLQALKNTFAREESVT